MPRIVRRLRPVPPCFELSIPDQTGIRKNGAVFAGHPRAGASGLGHPRIKAGPRYLRDDPSVSGGAPQAVWPDSSIQLPIEAVVPLHWLPLDGKDDGDPDRGRFIQ